MNVHKWKSVAIAIYQYRLLKALGEIKYRSPGVYVKKLIYDHVAFQAKKKDMSIDEFKKVLLEDK